jgi:cytochrome c-type biogenesis protein CcmH
MRVILSRMIFMLILVTSSASAVIETYRFSSSELEVRYHQLSAELRCPKCQNQNIADSNSPIAKDLRRLLHQQLEAGATNVEINQFMVERYGDFVLYRPRFSGVTIILWLAPAVLFLLAAFVVFSLLRKRDQGTTAGAKLTDVESERLRTLLDDRENPS